MDNYDKKLAAIKRILPKIGMSQDGFYMMLEKYNEKIVELNQRIYDHAQKFLTKNIKELDDGTFEYTLTQDDRDILDGYRKQNTEILEKEFPELFEVMDDLRIFEDNNF